MTQREEWRRLHEPPHDYVAGECVWCMTDFGHLPNCPLPQLLLAVALWRAEIVHDDD